MKEAKVRSSRGDAAVEGRQVRIIPLDLDLARRPFDVSAKRKCYIIFDKGPPPVLQEIDCGDIVIVDDKFTMD